MILAGLAGLCACQRQADHDAIVAQLASRAAAGRPAPPSGPTGPGCARPTDQTIAQCQLSLGVLNALTGTAPASRAH